MPPRRPAPRPRSPVSERVRERLQEIGLSENQAAAALGWSRGVLSAILRRVDAGGGFHSDTLGALEKLLGKPAQWILTGEEPAGVRLADCPGWADAATVARERYGLTDEQLRRIGAVLLPAAPRYVEPALLRALADVL